MGTVLKDRRRSRRNTVRVFPPDAGHVTAAPLSVRLRRLAGWTVWRYRYLAGFVLWGFLSILLELLLVTCLLPTTWPESLRSVLGFLAGLLFAFSMNARFNFRVPREHWTRTFVLFVLVSVFSYGLNLLAVAGMAWIDWADYPAARLCSSGMFCMIAYALHRRFTFRPSVRQIGLAVYAVQQEDLPRAYRQVGDQCDCLHVDLIDETFGAVAAPVDLEKLEEARRLWTWQPFHLHLMSRTPLRWIEQCGHRVECVLFHPEINDDPMEVIARCRQLGRQVGVVWTQESQLARLLPLLPHVDFVMVLGIRTPGISGQAILEEAIEAAGFFARLASRYTFETIFDGGVTPSNAGRIPARILVSNSSILRAEDPVRAVFRLKDDHAAA